MAVFANYFIHDITYFLWVGFLEAKFSKDVLKTHLFSAQVSDVFINSSVAEYRMDFELKSEAT